MIQANELRIGNLVTWEDEPNRILKVDEIGYNRWVRFENGDGSIIDDEECNLQPIPITEEWLLRFGFELELKEGNQNEYRVYSFNQITYNTNHGWWWNKCHLEVQPNNIHQLQNLFFALTGEELQFKPMEG
jgi:hypothetical protein